jgi:HlyD family secretion protein
MVDGGRGVPGLGSGEAQDIETLLGPETGGRGWLRARWAKLALVLGIAAGVLAAWYLYAAPGSRGGPVYVTAPAAIGDLTVTVTATGSVQPTNKVDVSSELSGTIRSVLVDYNSAVRVGQTLAELDSDKLRATLDSARARLVVAKAKREEAAATLRETTREYERKKALAGRQVSSLHDLDAALAAYERALTSVASAEADIGVAVADVTLNETNFGKARIVSPINGIVLSRNVDPGQTVASSLQAPVLFSIAEDLRQMEVQVDVDEADVGKVREGQRASFTVDAYPERKFPATISELRFASEVVQGVVTYKAVLTVDNSELLLRPGMTATAEITVEEVAGALLVPNAALRFAPAESAAPPAGGGFLQSLLPRPPQFRAASRRDEAGSARKLWILRDGAPVPVPVTIGASDGRRSEIRAGDLAAGQAVIVDSVAPGS